MRAHLDIKHEGTLDDESRVRMQIDSESTAFLMSILTDLYSDPELAVIREYSTNALDSHRAAGNPAPIEVELPSTLRPVFVVRDHGLGLSVDEITQNFSKYGWSSKRDTDTEVGMLGLGCKSGLTYSSQFTLVAVKNGVRATVLVTREADGAGAVQVIDTVCTEEPNGVEVQIPVKLATSFNLKAQQFFRFWEAGSVLVNGEAPKHITEGPDVLVIDPDVILSKDLACDYLVMGNVPYPIEEQVIYNSKWRVVAWVPIGSVDFTPSREALHMTKRSKEAVATLKDFTRVQLHRVAQRDIDGAATHWDALNREQNWRSVANVFKTYSGWTYRGEDIPHMPVYVNKERTLRWHGPYLDTASERPANISMRNAEKDVFLVGHNGRSFTRHDKERMRKWLEAKDLPTNTGVVALPRMVGSPWFDAVARILTMDELREIKVDMAPAPVAKGANGKYRVLDAYGELRYRDELRKHIVWMPAAIKVVRQDLMRFFCRFDDVSVIPVPKAQEARFLAENPTAIGYKEFIEAIVYLCHTSMTQAEVASIMLREEINASHVRFLWKARERIHDGDLVELIEIAQHDERNATSNLWSSLRTACQVADVEHPRLHKDRGLVQRFQAVRERYPLLEFAGRTSFGHYGGASIDDFVRYINLVRFTES